MSTGARGAAPEKEFVCPSKALRRFLAWLSARERPVLLDLGQVVGSNVTFFGERLGCKIFVEDLYEDIERFSRTNALTELPGFLKSRFTHPDGSVDGILCWDVIDYLERPTAYVLASELTRLLRPGGALLGFFATADDSSRHYTKYVVLDDVNLQHRVYPATVARQPVLLNRDIIKMFEGLLVSDSFLLKIASREILFRKPAYFGATTGSQI